MSDEGIADPLGKLLEHLRALEVELHGPLTQQTLPRWQHLLHPSFHEFGRSGGMIARADVFDGFLGTVQDYRVEAHDFAAALLAPDVALLTYRSCHVGADGNATRHTNRASIWQREADAGWRLRFHQGTPTAAF